MLSQASGVAEKCPDRFDTIANLRLRREGGNPWTDLNQSYPLPKLTKCTEFSLRPSYLDPSGVRALGLRWSPEDKQRVNRAVELMNAVWSSEQFKRAVIDAPLLWWKYSRPDGDPERHIQGLDLYTRLMSNQTPLVNYTITRGSAAAASGGDVTVFRNGYLRSANAYQLCNTISHEYTHLRYGGESEDWGFNKEPDVNTFVSYGVGGLTENLASREKLYGCDLTPRHASVPE